MLCVLPVNPVVLSRLPEPFHPACDVEGTAEDVGVALSRGGAAHALGASRRCNWKNEMQSVMKYLLFFVSYDQ